jgi:hypothetical protein
VAGGHAARVGAPKRHLEDTDVAVSADDLDQLRQVLADWHLREAHSGSLRPLLPGVAITEGCQGLWARRNAREPWQIDLLLDRSRDEWVFKRDAREVSRPVNTNSRSAWGAETINASVPTVSRFGPRSEIQQPRVPPNPPVPGTAARSSLVSKHT